MFKKIYFFLKAVLGPKVSTEEYSNRLNKCSDCIWNVKKENRNYCRECGCPQVKYWPWSELKTKATYKYSECPRKKWNK